MTTAHRVDWAVDTHADGSVLLRCEWVSTDDERGQWSCSFTAAAWAVFVRLVLQAVPTVYNTGGRPSGWEAS